MRSYKQRARVMVLRSMDIDCKRAPRAMNKELELQVTLGFMIWRAAFSASDTNLGTFWREREMYRNLLCISPGCGREKKCDCCRTSQSSLASGTRLAFCQMPHQTPNPSSLCFTFWSWAPSGLEDHGAIPVPRRCRLGRA